MAFCVALRRASPLAIRAVRGSLRIHSSAVLRSVPRSSVRRALRPPMVRFPSRGKTLTSDADLPRLINSEIKLAEDSGDRVEEVPEGFPFRILDREHNVITLERNYRGEAIKVVAYMPSPVTWTEPDSDFNYTNDDDGYGVKNPIQSSVSLSITISKGQGPCLEFSCTAYPHELTIESMTIGKSEESDGTSEESDGTSEESDADEEMIAYEEPNFKDLDKNLQKAFHKYLETRGISHTITNTLYEYMINRDSRDYLIWLKKVQSFIVKT